MAMAIIRLSNALTEKCWLSHIAIVTYWFKLISIIFRNRADAFRHVEYYLPWYVDINLCVRCTNPPSTSSKNILSEDYCKGHSPKRQKMGHMSQHSDSNGGNCCSDMAIGRPGHHSEERRLSLGYHSEIPNPSDIGVKISSCNLQLPSSPPPGDIKGVKVTELARHSPGDTGDRDGKFPASTSTSLVRRTKVGNLCNALDCTGVHFTSNQSSVLEIEMEQNIILTSWF